MQNDWCSLIFSYTHIYKNLKIQHKITEGRIVFLQYSLTNSFLKWQVKIPFRSCGASGKGKYWLSLFLIKEITLYALARHTDTRKVQVTEQYLFYMQICTIISVSMQYLIIHWWTFKLLPKFWCYKSGAMVINGLNSCQRGGGWGAWWKWWRD